MNAVRLLRYKRGISQREAAHLSGVSRSTIIRLERGAVPNAETAKALADFYKVPVTTILESEQVAA